VPDLGMGKEPVVQGTSAVNTFRTNVGKTVLLSPNVFENVNNGMCKNEFKFSFKFSFAYWKKTSKFPKRRRTGIGDCKYVLPSFFRIFS